MWVTSPSALFHAPHVLSSILLFLFFPALLTFPSVLCSSIWVRQKNALPRFPQNTDSSLLQQLFSLLCPQTSDPHHHRTCPPKTLFSPSSFHPLLMAPAPLSWKIHICYHLKWYKLIQAPLPSSGEDVKLFQDGMYKKKIVFIPKEAFYHVFHAEKRQFLVK